MSYTHYIKKHSQWRCEAPGCKATGTWVTRENLEYPGEQYEVERSTDRWIVVADFVPGCVPHHHYFCWKHRDVIAALLNTLSASLHEGEEHAE